MPALQVYTDEDFLETATPAVGQQVFTDADFLETAAPDRSGAFGAFADVGAGAARGGWAGLETIGRAARTAVPNEAFDQAITPAIDYAQGQQQQGWLRPSRQAGESELRRSLFEGAQSATQSLAAQVPGALAGLAGGALGVAAGGAASGGAIFGLAQYDQLREDFHKRNGVDIETLPGPWKAAIKSSLSEAGSEAATDLASNLIFGGAGKGLALAGKGLIGGTKEIVKAGAKGFLKAAPVEVGGEMANAAYQDTLNPEMGVESQGAWNAAQQVVGPTLVATALGGVAQQGAGAFAGRTTAVSRLKTIVEAEQLGIPNPSAIPQDQLLAFIAAAKQGQNGAISGEAIPPPAPDTDLAPEDETARMGAILEAQQQTQTPPPIPRQQVPEAPPAGTPPAGGAVQTTPPQAFDTTAALRTAEETQRASVQPPVDPAVQRLLDQRTGPHRQQQRQQAAAEARQRPEVAQARRMAERQRANGEAYEEALGLFDRAFDRRDAEVFSAWQETLGGGKLGVGEQRARVELASTENTGSGSLVGEPASNLINGNAAPSESFVDGVLPDSEFLGGVFRSQTFLDKGYRGLDVETQRDVVRAMLRLGHDPKIANSVVQLVPVDMMDRLRREKISPEMLFHDSAVLSHALSVGFTPDVSIFTDASDAPMRTTASARAIKDSGFIQTNATGSSENITSTDNAFASNPIHTKNNTRHVRQLSREKLSQEFPAEQVQEHDDGSHTITLDNGHKIEFFTADSLTIDPVRGKKSIQEHGEAAQGKVLGLITFGENKTTIQLTDTDELTHELGHFFVERFATPSEQLLLRKEFRDNWEDFAKDYKNFRQGRASRHASFWQQVVDFLVRVRNLVHTTKGGIYREIESGRGYKREIGGERAVKKQVRAKMAMPDRLPGETREAYMVRAFQGGPHKIEGPKDYTLSKSGTGEGAAAYGFGAYFSSLRDVAEEYQRTLSDPRVAFDREPKTPAEKEVERYINTAAKITQADYRAAAVKNRYREILRWGDDISEAAKNLGEPRLDNYGYLYHAELDVNDEDLLDWDKPLSEQSEKVRAILAKPIANGWADQQGRAFYEALAIREAKKKNPKYSNFRADEEGGDQEAASRYLASIGIPGIRYLDGGSRGKGDGTHNYVIFDDKLITLTHRNDEEMRASFVPRDETVSPEERDRLDQAEANRRREDAIRTAEVNEKAQPTGYKVYEYVTGSKTPRQYRGSYKTEEQAKARVKMLGDRATYEATYPAGYDRHLEENTGGTREGLAERARKATYQVGRMKAEEQRASVTPQQDAEYLAAAERGDTETAQRMVDDAAKAAGYNSPVVFHGSPYNDITSFKTHRGKSEFYFSDDSEEAGFFAGAETSRGGNAYMPKSKTARVYKSYVAIRNPFIVNVKGELFDPDMMDGILFDARKQGRDGAIIKNIVNFEDGESSTTTVVFSPSQIKSADPITRDDQGNVVPLSERFNATSDDTRYSLSPAEKARKTPEGGPKYAQHDEHDAHRVNLETLPPEYRDFTQQIAENQLRPSERRSWTARPHADVLAKAKQIIAGDASFQKLVSRNTTAAVKDEQLTALAIIYANSVTRAQDAHGAAVAAPTEENKAKLALATVEAHAVYSKLFGARAEAGRALGSIRLARAAIAKGGGAPAIMQALSDRGVNLSQEELAQLTALPPGDMRAYLNFMAAALRARKGHTANDYLTAYRMFNMLANTSTQSANVVSNGLKTALDVLPDTVEALLSKDKHLSDVWTYYKALLRAMPTSSRSAAQTLYKSGGISDFELSKGIYSGVAGEKASSEFAGGAWNPINMGMRVTRAGDVLFSDAHYLAATEMLARRAGKDQGLSGAALDSFVETTRQSGDYHEQALEAAKEKTFQEDSKTLSAFMNLLRQPGMGWVRWILPFVKTPWNINAAAMRMVPGVGVLASKMQGKTMTRAVAEQSLGVGFTLMGMSLAAAGKATGAPPDDEGGKDKFFNAEKKEAYSVRVGDTWIKYSRLGPLAMPLLAGVALNEYRERGEENKSALAAVGKLFGRIGKMVSDQSMLQGLNGFSKAVAEPDKYFENFIKGIAGQLVPAASAQRQVTRGMESEILETDDWIDKLLADLPRAERDAIADLLGRKSLPQKADSLGRPQEHRGQGWLALAGWIKHAEDNTDPVVQELIDLGIKYPTAVGKAISEEITAEQMAAKKARLGRELMPSEMKQTGEIGRDELTAKRTSVGQAVYDAVKNIMAQDYYQKMSAVDRATVLTRTVNSTKSKAGKRWAAEGE